MDSISRSAIAGPTFTASLRCHRSHGFSFLNSRVPSPTLRRVAKRGSIFAEIQKQSPAIDFSDPDWKIKYQTDFERRFNIPHITDLFPDAESIPSTFCLKMRCLLFL